MSIVPAAIFAMAIAARRPSLDPVLGNVCFADVVDETMLARVVIVVDVRRNRVVVVGRKRVVVVTGGSLFTTKCVVAEP